jgi:TolA-binding protein
MRCGVLFAVPWALLAGAQSARAQQSPPTESMAQSTVTDEDMTDLKARGHFRLGREYYEQGRFADAAKEFEVAYGLSGRGELLFNVYLAYRDAQDVANAARALRGYLAAVADVEEREHLTARLAALDAQLAQAEQDAARQRADTAESERQRKDAEQQRQDAERRARDAELRAQQRPERPLWPWLLVGGGIAVSGTGVVLGVLASKDGDELRGDCVADPRTDGASAPLQQGMACAPGVDLESRRKSIQTQATVADVLWIGGAVVAATGIVLALALPDEYPDELPVSLGCGPADCGAAVRLAF